MDGRTNIKERRKRGQKDGWIEKSIGGSKEEKMKERQDGWMKGRMSGWKKGKMDDMVGVWKERMDE